MLQKTLIMAAVSAAFSAGAANAQLIPVIDEIIAANTKAIIDVDSRATAGIAALASDIQAVATQANENADFLATHDQEMDVYRDVLFGEIGDDGTIGNGLVDDVVRLDGAITTVDARVIDVDQRATAGVDQALSEIGATQGRIDQVDQRATAAVNNIGNRLTAESARLDGRISQVEREMSAGIAGALAVNSIPQAVAKGGNTIGAGIGTYNGRSALAVGFSRRFDSVTIKAGLSYDSENNTGGSIGVGYSF